MIRRRSLRITELSGQKLTGSVTLSDGALGFTVPPTLLACAHEVIE